VKNTSGYSLVCSDNSLVENNFFENNSGVYFGYTTENNIVRNNTLIRDGFFVDRNLIQFSNNTVNGKPIIYSYKPSDQVFDQPAGQIIVVLGHHCIIRNLNLSDTAYGLVLSGYGCTVENITAQNDNAYGLSVWGSDNIIKNCKVSQSGNGMDIRCNGQHMTNCTVTQVRGVGIYAWCEDFSIGYCNVTDAGQVGFYAEGENFIIDHCSIKDSAQSGIYVDIAYNMSIKHCRIENAGQYGILFNGSGNQMSFNSIKNTSLGVYWNGFCSVEHNDFIGNKQSAKFHLEYGHLFKTQWVDNYWEHPQSKPKIISGKADILLFHFWYLERVLTIRFFGIDFAPAQNPHFS
jgi:parallel beta-helix repeat protein